MARLPFLKSLEPHSPLSREEALAPLVVALPPGDAAAELERFPALVQATHWPTVDDVPGLATLVRARAGASGATLWQLLGRAGATDLRDELLELTRLPPPLPLNDVPHAPAGIQPSIRDAFVGRADDLWRIDTLLTGRDQGVVPSAAFSGSIQGFGGLGKTRLALEYLHRFAPRRFPGGVFWIDADADVAGLEARHHDILQVLDPAAAPLAAYRDPRESRDLAADLRRAVAAIPAHRPALFIVDNVPEPEAGRSPEQIGHWCPAFGVAAVLFTSRGHLSAGAAGAVAAISMDVLQEGAAIQLLTREVPDRGAIPRSDWAAVAEWVGGLPLALELLNAVLRTGGASPPEILAQSRSTSTTAALDDAGKSLRGVVPPGSLRGVSAVFSLSYDRLGEEEQEAARLLAWLAPDPIPMEIVGALGDPPFSASARVGLTTRSFVTRVASPDTPLYGTMHRVLADFLRGRSPRPQAEVARVAERLATLMNPERFGSPREWPRLNRLRPHGVAVFDRLAPLRGGADWLQVLTMLGLTIGRAYEDQGFAREAEPVLRRVLQERSPEPGEEDGGTLIVQNNLANNLLAQGDIAGAHALLTSVLQRMERVFPVDHPARFMGMLNMAEIHRARGDLATARMVAERALADARKAVGEEHPATIAAMNNLGLTLHAQGDFAGARELQERVLDAAKRVFDEDHPRTITSRNNLAETLRAQGDLSAARPLYDEGTRAADQELGEDHPVTLAARANAANAAMQAGDYALARSILERALEAMRRVRGDEHPDTLAVMGNLAEAHANQGDMVGARTLSAQMAEASERVLGERHPLTLMAMNTLATILHQQGDMSRARQIHERVVGLSRGALGEEHPTTLIALSNLAEVLRAQGDLHAARRLHERALESKKRVLGGEHPETLMSMHNLGALRYEQGDFTGARPIQEGALAASRRVAGETHPDTLWAMNNLAATLLAQGEFAGARALQEQTLDACTRTLGDEHPLTAIAQGNLAETLLLHGQLDAARSLQERGLDATLRRVGEDHVDTLGAMNRLYTILAAQRDLEGARRLEDRMRAITRRLGGG